MSKGNINYKYLRRRQSWFRRNLPLVVIISILVILLIAAGITVAVLYSNGIIG